MHLTDEYIKVSFNQISGTIHSALYKPLSIIILRDDFIAKETEAQRG
jgi:hypothetical protein